MQRPGGKSERILNWPERWDSGGRRMKVGREGERRKGGGKKRGGDRHTGDHINMCFAEDLLTNFLYYS